MNILLLITVLVCLTVHRYVSIGEELGLLNFVHGFHFFIKIFFIFFIIALIWQFGIFAAAIIFILIFFNFLPSATLWIFLLPEVIRFYRIGYVDLGALFKRINKIFIHVYNWFVIIFSILVVINFFTSSYMETINGVLSKYSYEELGYATLLIIVIGNLLRGYVQFILERRFNKTGGIMVDGENKYKI